MIIQKLFELTNTPTDTQQKLLKQYPSLLELKDITDDTREISTNTAFVLRQGQTPLTPEFAQKLLSLAHQNNAQLIIMDPSLQLETPPLPILHLNSPHLNLAKLANIFYQNPSNNLKLIAVTGTNGKTTTTYIIEALAKSIGLKTGVIGTISHRCDAFTEPAINTTPGILKLYKLLHQMKKAGTQLVAMETSSHALELQRIEKITFDAAIWTNLGTDHLDFHITQENYANAKLKLFTQHLKNNNAILNADDEHISKLIPTITQHLKNNILNTPITFSINSTNATYHLQNINFHDQNFHATIHSELFNTPIRFQLPLMGIYNLQNALAAYIALTSLGYDPITLAQNLKHIPQIPGRLQKITHQPNTPTVIVDFAHTPEALKNALQTLKNQLSNDQKLILVFGAGGDRDPSKRPIMGNIAASNADFTFITSDNPRTENPQTIIDEITLGIPQNLQKNTQQIENRKIAINTAINMASPNDIVLIAGKGHEDYQIIGTTKYHFDDCEVATDALKTYQQSSSSL